MGSHATVGLARPSLGALRRPLRRVALVGPDDDLERGRAGQGAAGDVLSPRCPVSSERLAVVAATCEACALRMLVGQPSASAVVDRYRQSKVDEESLSAKTITRLGQILEVGVEYELVARNPVRSTPADAS